MDNYPDDIRSYDSHPDSPFYKEPDACDECGAELESEPDEDGGAYTWCPECKDND